MTTFYKFMTSWYACRSLKTVQLCPEFMSYNKVYKSSPMYFAIGLCISITVVIVAFEWKTYNERGLVEFTPTLNEFDEILNIPNTVQPPPPPPKQTVVEVVEVDEEVVEELDIEIDLEVTEEDIFDEVTIMALEVEEEQIDEIITIAEVMPSPIGGYDAFYQFVAKNIQYPGMARKAGIEGKVTLELTIGKDGKIQKANPVRGIGFGCDEEAIRVVKLYEGWNPGMQRGVPRTIRMYLPMVFKLGS